MKRRQDIRQQRKEKRRPWSLQAPDQERRADRDAAFAELERERAAQTRKSVQT